MLIPAGSSYNTGPQQRLLSQYSFPYLDAISICWGTYPLSFILHKHQDSFQIHATFQYHQVKCATFERVLCDIMTERMIHTLHASSQLCHAGSVCPYPAQMWVSVLRTRDHKDANGELQTPAAQCHHLLAQVSWAIARYHASPLPEYGLAS